MLTACLAIIAAVGFVGDDTDVVAIEISIEAKEEYVFGNPIKMTAIFTNTSDQPITREEPFAGRKVAIEVQSLDDESYAQKYYPRHPLDVEQTEEQKKPHGGPPKRQPKKVIFEPRQPKTVIFEPGQTRRFDFDLNADLTITELVPGEWLVWVDDNAGRRDEVESGRVPFKLIFNHESVKSMLAMARDKSNSPGLRRDATFWLNWIKKDLNYREVWKVNNELFLIGDEQLLQKRLVEFEKFWKTNTDSEAVKEAIQAANTGKIHRSAVRI